MGRGQVVRHRVLVPAFGGSNPSVPAKLRPSAAQAVFVWLTVKAIFKIEPLGSITKIWSERVWKLLLYFQKKKGEDAMPSLLQANVLKTIQTYDLAVEELPCDPAYADTAAFNEQYGFTADEAANTLLVASKKADPIKYAVCVVLASTRLDVNKKVTQLLDVKKASFADSETTKQLTGMEIGGVTAVGIEQYPILVDAAVLQQPRIVMGGGNRRSKLVMSPQELLKLPHVTVVTDLAKPNG